MGPFYDNGMNIIIELKYPEICDNAQVTVAVCGENTMRHFVRPDNDLLLLRASACTR